MAGETDLPTILASLRVGRRDGFFTMVTLDEPVPVGAGVEAVIVESEGVSVVATVEEAERRGWPVEFRAAWLTIEVHTDLEGVGLTAAMSAALSNIDVPANVIAGYYHDHLLVPAERVDDAIAALESLRSLTEGG